MMLDLFSTFLFLLPQCNNPLFLSFYTQLFKGWLARIRGATMHIMDPSPRKKRTTRNSRFLLRLIFATRYISSPRDGFSTSKSYFLHNSSITHRAPSIRENEVGTDTRVRRPRLIPTCSISTTQPRTRRRWCRRRVGQHSERRGGGTRARSRRHLCPGHFRFRVG